eukprot:gene15595-6865_t
MSGGIAEGNNEVRSDNKESIKPSQDIMQKEIASLKEENSQLKGLVETRDKRISLLEGQLKSKEQKYHNDLKLVQRNIAELKSEIDAKSNTIAYLTTQLHQLKMRGAKPDSNVGQIVPAPPREGTPRTRALRRTATSPTTRSFSPSEDAYFTSHQVDISELPVQSAIAIKGKNLPSRPAQSLSNPARPALGHSAARRERELHLYSRPKPSDYKDFINAPLKGNDVNFLPKPPAAPLPPISASKNGRQQNVSNMRQSKEKGLTDSRHKKISARGGEITEVVVDPLSSPERTWRKVQDSKYRE